MECFIGIDVGTSAVKAAAIGPDGQLIADAEMAIRTSRPQPGWAEQHPNLWVDAARKVLAVLSGKMPGGLSGAKAIGLSGQMHGLVVLDQDRRPLRDAILWNDARAADQATWLNRQNPDIGAQLGVPATPSFVAPKWVWLCQHEPEIASATRTILLPKDYLRMQLTGDLGTDVVDASGAWLLDQDSRDWSDAALELCGIDPAQLPQLHESAAIAGHVTAAAARDFGLPAGVPVIVGAGDAAAGCVGLRLFRPGQAFINLGTSAQIFVTSDRHQPDPASMTHSFAHAVPGRWFQMAALLNGAGALGWMAELLDDSPANLAQAGAGAWSPDIPLCLPYFSGERSPHNHPNARAAFIGLSQSTSRPEMAASVMDGVALALRDAYGALQSSGIKIETIGATGGGARDAFWLKLIASALDVPIEVFGGAASGAAVGAALLARVTAAPLDDLPPLPVALRVTPDAGISQAMAARYDRYRWLYRAIRQDFDA